MEDGWCSGESNAPSSSKRNGKRIKKKKPTLPFQVVCEPIGDFAKFETILKLDEPLVKEDPRPETVDLEDMEREVLEHHDTLYERNLRRYGKPEFVSIRYDVDYRMEHPEVKEAVEERAIVSWTRKGKKGCDQPIDESDSETEPSTAEFIASLEKKKESGWVTDETLYYDEDADVVRNLHKSSVSLTNYKSQSFDNRDFGNPVALYPIMTSEERLSTNSHLL